MPHYVAGKEISLEDIRLALEKMPDRFQEHLASMLVLTNVYYSEAPWLRVRSPAAASSLVWHELPLEGRASFEFEEQIGAPFVQPDGAAGQLRATQPLEPARAAPSLVTPCLGAGCRAVIGEKQFPLSVTLTDRGDQDECGGHDRSEAPACKNVL